LGDKGGGEFVSTRPQNKNDVGDGGSKPLRRSWKEANWN